MSLSTVLSKK